jgi:Amt family ammonium transporter
LFFGWFGFNPGSSLGFMGASRVLAVNAAVNTLIAGAVGGCAAMLYMWLISPVRKPDPSMSVNGILAGLVAITAPCAFVDSIGATAIGLVAGVLVCLAAAALEKLHIDDPVGAVPVHFVNGIWGVLAVGIFAKGIPETAGWNGMESAVTGLLYGGGTQILDQLAEVAAVIIFAFGLSFVFFKVLSALKLLRSKPEDELAGLDMPEMGTPGYTSVDVRMAGGRLSVQTPAVRSASASIPTTGK